MESTEGKGNGKGKELNFRENELEVASSAEGVGEAHESMTITYSGRPLSISFNPDFFMAP